MVKKTKKITYTSGTRNRKNRAKQLTLARQNKRDLKLNAAEEDMESVSLSDQRDQAIDLSEQDENPAQGLVYLPMATVIDSTSIKSRELTPELSIEYTGLRQDPEFRRALKALEDLKSSGQVQRLSVKRAKTVLRSIRYKGAFKYVIKAYQIGVKRFKDQLRSVKRDRLRRYEFDPENPYDEIPAYSATTRKVRQQHRVAYVNKQLGLKWTPPEHNSKRNLSWALKETPEVRLAIDESFFLYPDHPTWAGPHQKRLRYPVKKGGVLLRPVSKPRDEEHHSAVRKARELDAIQYPGNSRKLRRGLPGAI